MTAHTWTVLHQMRFEQTDKTKEWICDDCPRRVRVWPDFEIIEHGDTTVTHVGSFGGIRIETELHQEIV